MLIFQDPITPLLDKQQIALTVVSVGLFLGAIAMQWVTKVSLEKANKQLEALQDTAQKAVDNSKQVYDLLVRVQEESHEQWATVNNLQRLLTENNIHVENMADVLEKIKEQQTVLATTQIQQHQGTQKVIEGLIDALSEQHTRD